MIKISPECVLLHCILHSETLAAKNIKSGGNGENDTTFAKLLQEVVGIVNHIRSYPKKRRIFTKLCEQMDASSTELLLHMQV